MKRYWNNSLRLFSAILLVVLMLLARTAVTPVTAANPTTVSFQGKVTNADGTNVTDGNYPFVFRLYTVSSAGTAIWTETQSSVSVAAGVFQVNLGSTCPFFTANACNGNTVIDFNANPNLYLGITFNNDVAGEMTPRVQMQSVPFAFNSDKVGGLSASQLVQLSPGSQQSGNVNVSGSGTFATSIITPSLTASGALAISSGGANNVSIDTGASGGTIAIGGTNATSVELSRTGVTTRVKGALQIDQGATTTGAITMTFTGTQSLSTTSNLNGSVNGISFVGTPSATAGTTSGLFVQQANSANTNGLDNGITIDNADNNLAVGAAINITNSGGGGYTNLIQGAGFTVNGTGAVTGSAISTSGTITAANNLSISAFGSGAWIDLPTAGPSGIGSGGAGSNAWIGYAPANGNWFTDALTGDIAYRNTAGRLLFGNSGGNAQTVMSTAATVFQNSSALALFTVDNTNTRLQVGSATTDANGVLFVLDSYNGASDPTGVNGASYYSTSKNSMRCYEDNAWSDCASTHLAGETTLAAAAGTMTVTLTKTYEYLQCRMDIKGTSANAAIYLRFNGDTAGTSYGWNEYSIIAAAVTDAQDASDSEIQLTGTDTTNAPASANVDITNWSDISKIVDWTYAVSTPIGTNNRRYSGAGGWANTTAQITSVSFVTSAGTFNTGSHAWCEGRNVR